MPNLTARQMLSRIPVRMAAGGEARGFSDDEVKQFIQSTYAQFGGPGVEAHRAIADAMAQYGVGVDQVARVSGYSPQEVQAEIMGQQAASQQAAQQAAAQEQAAAQQAAAAQQVAAQQAQQQAAERDRFAGLSPDVSAGIGSSLSPTGITIDQTAISNAMAQYEAQQAAQAQVQQQQAAAQEQAAQQAAAQRAAQEQETAAQQLAQIRAQQEADQARAAEQAAAQQAAQQLADREAAQQAAARFEAQQVAAQQAAEAERLRALVPDSPPITDTFDFAQRDRVAAEQAAAQRAQDAAAQQQVLPPPTPPTPAPTPASSAAAQRLDMLIAQDQAMAPVSSGVSDMVMRDISGGPASVPTVASTPAEQQGTAAGVSAAYRKAMETGGQQTVGDYYANLRKDAEAYLANPNAPTGVDAYNLLVESGISTSDLRAAGVADAVLDKIFTVSGPIEQSKFVTPTGMTSAYERSPDLAFESQRLTALGQDGRGILDTQGRDYIANLQKDGIDAAERAQMLEYATERGYSFDDLLKAGVDPNVLFTQPAAAPPVVNPPVVNPPVVPPPVVAGPSLPPPGTVANPIDTRGNSGVTTFLDTYNPTPPFVAPTYTAPTVYQPIKPQPDIFAAGETALDTTFRESAPRTAIPGMPGQFDYTPAAKLRSATGSGFTFTPPSITTRPRSLLSPREIQAYGGTMSKSQIFAQNRALIDRNLRDMLGATPALRNASTYNLLRNRVMAGEFGADPARVFNPETTEGQKFQAFLASLAGTAPAQAAATGAATGTVADSVIDIDPTDRQIAAGSGTTSGSTVAGGYAAPIDASPLAYGGYRLEPFKDGGEATSSRRMLESLFGKKSDGSAKDELARFAEGGEARVGGSAPAVAGRTGRAARKAADPQTESRTMLERISNVARGANQAFYENVSKPAVGTAIDMTLGLGDLVQMGARYLGNRAGLDAGEFTPVAQPVKEALGVEDYNPYTVGGLGASILPFATAGRAAAATTRALPGAMLSPTGSPSAARQLSSMFPNLGRETGAYVAAETGAAAAGELAPDSALAELAGAALGSTGANIAMGSPTTARAQMDNLPQRVPTVETPFVGRLDAFVSRLQGRTTLPNLVNQIQGKLRDYDIARVKRIMQDVPADAKFTSAEILEKLQANYNPANFKVTQVTSPLQLTNFYEGMDDPWSKDFVPPKHSTIVLSVNDFSGVGISPEMAQEARDGLLRLDPDYRVMHDLDLVNPIHFSDYYRPLVNALSLEGSVVSQAGLATLGRIEDRAKTAAEDINVLIAFPARMRQEAGYPRFFAREKNRLLEQGGVPAEKVLTKAYVSAFQQGYDEFATRLKSRLPGVERLKELPVFRAEAYENLDTHRVPEFLMRFVNRDITPLLNSVIRETELDNRAYINEQEAMLAGNQELKDILTGRTQAAGFMPGSNPSYLGQHPSVTGKVKNHVFFSRASDVTANIPEIGPDARGIYVHELQSDLVDDLYMSGGRRGLTTSELEKRRDEVYLPAKARTLEKVKTNREKVAQLEKDYTELRDFYNQRETTQQIPTTFVESARLTEIKDEINKIRRENNRLSGTTLNRIESALDNVESRIRGESIRDPLVDEAFVGMDTNPKALQQLMIKAAVKAAVDRGHDFVALTSPLHSAQPQLYERIPQNARDVVKDLGEGFQVTQVELKTEKGPFKTTAIVWGRDAAGREGVNRLLTQGVPFKEGGEVTSSRRMLDDVIGKKPEGQRVDATGLLGFANGGEARVGGSAPAVAGRTGRAAQLAAQRAEDSQTESAQMLERLLAATPVERAVFESTGMEPGLDRASMLPFAGSREEGNLQLAAPGLVYDAARAFVTPGMAARGQRVSDEDILNTAMNVMGGGVGASRVAGPRIASDETLLGMGMAVRPAGKAADDLAALTAKAPTQTIDIPTGKSEKVTTSVPRYWYHSLRGRKLGESGEITPYSRGRETEELLKEGFKDAPANAVYLSPTPFDSNSVRIDVNKLDPSLMRLTGQAEGYAIYAGAIPANAIDDGAVTAQASAEVSPNLTQFLKNSQVKEPVFHAAKADVKEFSPKYRTELSSMGFHFGTADQANFRTNQYDFDSKSPNIGKYYLNIENPLEVSHMASFAPDHLAEQMMDMGLLTEKAYDGLSAKNNYDAIATGDSLVKILKKNGYDGLKYRNEREGDGFSFVPFNPTQIKSAIGNVGTFDPSTPVITKAKGGTVTKKAKNNVERVRNDNRRYL